MRHGPARDYFSGVALSACDEPSTPFRAGQGERQNGQRQLWRCVFGSDWTVPPITTGTITTGTITTGTANGTNGVAPPDRGKAPVVVATIKPSCVACCKFTILASRYAPLESHGAALTFFTDLSMLVTSQTPLFGGIIIFMAFFALPPSRARFRPAGLHAGRTAFLFIALFAAIWAQIENRSAP
jgi:hypothetical protein